MDRADVVEQPDEEERDDRERGEERDQLSAERHRARLQFGRIRPQGMVK
jgi:hypothetical protein